MRRIPRCTPGHKTGQQFTQRRFQSELPALDEEHGRSCSRYNFSQAGHVKHGLGGNCGRVLFIGEPPQSSLEHDVITCQNTERAAREGSRCDGVFQNPESSGKPIGFSGGVLSNWGSLRGHGFLVG